MLLLFFSLIVSILSTFFLYGRFILCFYAFYDTGVNDGANILGFLLLSAPQNIFYQLIATAIALYVCKKYVASIRSSTSAKMFLILIVNILVIILSSTYEVLRVSDGYNLNDPRFYYPERANYSIQKVFFECPHLKEDSLNGNAAL